MTINYQNTVKVFFTKDQNDIAKYIETNNYKKVLIVTGSTKTKDVAFGMINTFEQFDVKVLTGVTTNAHAKWIQEVIPEVRLFSPDVIVTVGGGSVHDSGKALSILANSHEGYTIEDYTVDGRLSVPGIKSVLPVITVPTLCGSGAEVSPAALVTINKQKRVVFSPLLHPVATFVNTDYFRMLSIHQLSRSAFDSFIQATEGLISTSANNLSNAFAEDTITYFNDVLPYLAMNDWSVISEDMLEKLAIASVFSSYVCSTSSVGAIHAISDPISGRYNVHHGTALAMVAPFVLKQNLKHTRRDALERLDELLNSFESVSGDLVERVVIKVNNVIDSLHLLDEIKDFSINRLDIPLMASEAFNPDMAGNPYEFTFDEICKIIGRYCDD